MLKVLQEPLVEAVAVEMSHFSEPVPIARDRIGCFKPRTYEHVCCDFRAFLRGIRIDRMHAAKPRRQYPKHAELPGYLLPPTVRSGTNSERRIRVNRLPDPRRPIGFVRHQQALEKGRSRAGHTGDEQRSVDWL